MGGDNRRRHLSDATESARSVSYPAMGRFSEPDAPDFVRNDFGRLLLGIGLIVFLLYAGSRTWAGLRQGGLQGQTLVSSGVNRQGRPYEWWVPTKTMLLVLPTVVVGGGLWLRFGFRDDGWS